jgi:hypothetical protein
MTSAQADEDEVPAKQGVVELHFLPVHPRSEQGRCLVSVAGSRQQQAGRSLPVSETSFCLCNQTAETHAKCARKRSRALDGQSTGAAYNEANGCAMHAGGSAELIERHAFLLTQLLYLIRDLAGERAPELLRHAIKLWAAVEIRHRDYSLGGGVWME